MEEQDVNPEHDGYYHFTGRQRLDKAMHSLEGILKGISADSSSNEKEVMLLLDWLEENREFERRHPFNEIIPRIADALDDRAFDNDELSDVLWLCSQYTTNEIYFDSITSDMQRLQGILSGIAADGIVTMAELDALSMWMEEHEHLRTCWPYDELEGLLTEVRKDRFIDAKEHELLRAFFSEFTRLGKHRAITPPPLNAKELTARGICAVCPEVKFEGRTFCFTGASKHVSRAEFQKIVEHRGGQFAPNLVKSAHYLVVGADGNPCWAYSCYGRKVELAIRYRKEGARLLIVHEVDFWDAMGGIQGAMPMNRDIQAKIDAATLPARQVQEKK